MSVNQISAPRSGGLESESKGWFHIDCSCRDSSQSSNREPKFKKDCHKSDTSEFCGAFDSSTRLSTRSRSDGRTRVTFINCCMSDGGEAENGMSIQSFDAMNADFRDWTLCTIWDKSTPQPATSYNVLRAPTNRGLKPTNKLCRAPDLNMLGPLAWNSCATPLICIARPNRESGSIT